MRSPQCRPSGALIIPEQFPTVETVGYLMPSLRDF
jgi:hypothetical protein